MGAHKDYVCDVRGTSYDKKTAKRRGMTPAQIKAEAAADQTPAMSKEEARRQSRIALLNFLRLNTKGV